MKNELMIVWTTDNKETIMNMICLYAINAKKKGWMDEITVLIWGASQMAVCEDKDIEDKIKEMVELGVNVVACKKCTENMFIEGQLESCGVNVYYTGELLSDWLKSGKSILTF